MKTDKTKYDFFLLLAALIWGSAFVAQRVGSQYIGAFAFNGLRFALGGLSVLPVLLLSSRKDRTVENRKKHLKSAVVFGLIAGVALFLGCSLQQIGIAETTAGKAAFITGLYIVLVPVAGIFMRHAAGVKIWIGVGMALIGLYLLSIQEGFTISRGDLFELIGAFVWTAHILLIDRFSKKVDCIYLSFFQFITCALLSLIAAMFFESLRIEQIVQAAVPILYGGILSVGVAYTLQVVGQKKAQPSHAALILSLEAAFACIGGLLLLNEQLNLREAFGCVLMFAGMLVSQIPGKKQSRTL